MTSFALLVDKSLCEERGGFALLLDVDAHLVLFVVAEGPENNGLVAPVVWVPRLQLHDLLGLVHQVLHLTLVFQDLLPFFLQLQIQSAFNTGAP